MSIIRLIITTVPPEYATQAEHNWKHYCAPLMIRQSGCLSEKMLRCDAVPGEYISYSEWEVSVMEGTPLLCWRPVSRYSYPPNFGRPAQTGRTPATLNVCRSPSSSRMETYSPSTNA